MFDGATGKAPPGVGVAAFKVGQLASAVSSWRFARERGGRGDGFPSRARALALPVAAALLLTPPEAAALELFGHKLFDTAWLWGAGPEAADADAQPYEILFTVAGDDAALAGKLQAASLLYARRDEVPQSTAAFLARGRGDYQRILAALYGEARYGGAILISVDGAAVETIPADAALRDPAQVTVEIDPGPLFRFGALTIANAPPVPADDDDPPATPEELGFVAGAPARAGVVLKVENTLVGLWRENGYPKAAIADRRTVANQAGATLDVAIQVAPGPPAVIGPVTVTGTQRMNPDFLVWYSALERGRPYDPDDLTRAGNQMRRLEVFQSARILEDAPVERDGELPLTIAVAERPLRVLGAGASFSTLDGAGIEGYWQYRNLFGEAERLRFDARVSGIEDSDFSNHDYYGALSFTKPGVITPFTDFEARLFAEQEVPETFREQTYGGRAGFHHRFSETLEGRAALSGELITTEDVFGDRNFTLVSVPVELDWDRRDDRLDPSEGFRLVRTLEPFHEFTRSTTGLIAGVEGSAYHALDAEGRYVLAGRVEVGSISGAPASMLPTSRLYFAGGGGSIRGYAHKNVGPRLADGTVVGGRSLFEASAELRIKITETVGVVPFVDTGNAFSATLPDFSQPLKTGAGVGVRYDTGLGPLRLDVAVPLDPAPDDPDYGIYIGLGQAF